MRKSCVLLLIVPLFVCSCAGTGNFRKPFGDKVTVILRGPSIHDGEAIAVSDSLMYLDVGKEVCAAPLSDVERVYVHGYKIDPVTRWFWGSTFFAAGTASAVMILMDTESGVGSFVLAAIDMAMGAGAASVYAVPERDVVIYDLSTPDQLERLSLYCRYPQGLTDSQWTLLLESRGQADVVRLPRQ